MSKQREGEQRDWKDANCRTLLERPIRRSAPREVCHGQVVQELRARGLPKAPPMFQLGEPEVIEAVMRDAGFTSVQRSEIASVWQARRAEDIVEMLDRGTVRTSTILDRQGPGVRKRILEEIVKAFRPYETRTGLEVACSSILATGIKPD